ncbi:hypothetical protein CLV74_101482 [Donghicola tyrosinivorans]|uniref:Uncharacterized protein n=1 Tax=Donghicola tyrosinivorans TaxID=1652492 RepID=A0A2T0X5Z1_9RHOB|nr:hypothetical protein CLV74_101482 [Donghicola tyrosinivorans]
MTFYSQEHEQSFKSASELVRRGGAQAPVCGARTRTGAACQQIPIREGKGRCLRHAGPHAARAFRQRQRDDFMAGKVSADAWRRSEARRAVNRLARAWRSNPWLPGSTVDLAGAEQDFRSELSCRLLNVEAMPPAVADWLRWRYRRTQIDRQSEALWLRDLLERLPERLAAAGPRPAADVEAAPLGKGAGACWTVKDDAGQGRSSRMRDDVPKAPPVVRIKKHGRRGRPKTQDAGEIELRDLMEIYRENRAVLSPMLGQCAGEAERLAVLRALRDFQADPQESGPRAQWLEYVRLLRVT